MVKEIDADDSTELGVLDDLQAIAGTANSLLPTLAGELESALGSFDVGDVTVKLNGLKGVVHEAIENALKGVEQLADLSGVAKASQAKINTAVIKVNGKIDAFRS